MRIVTIVFGIIVLLAAVIDICLIINCSRLERLGYVVVDMDNRRTAYGPSDKQIRKLQRKKYRR